MKFYDINGLEKTDLQVIQDTGWIILNKVKYRKLNGVVYINVDVNDANMVSGYNAIETLPQGFRPEINIYAPIATIGYSDNGSGVWISTNGTIFIYQIVARKTNYSINVSYPV